MAKNDSPSTGFIAWADLTVQNADNIRDFYSSVIGWKHVDVSMGAYNDYSMLPPGSDAPVAGVCHARGQNADLPAAWLLYILVEDLDKSVQKCKEMGGTVISGPRTAGSHGRFCVIQDPAGAAVALFQASV